MSTDAISAGAGAPADATAAPSYRDGISDTDIMKQQDEIKAEVGAQALVGELESPESLISEYEDNPAFLPKLRDLAARFSGIRRNRGDGNCFYRSFLISLGERFVDAHVVAADKRGDAPASPLQTKYEQLLEYVRDSKDKLLAFGYPDITLSDFHEALLEYLGGLAAAGATKQTHVYAPFRDQMTGFYIITMLRCLCSLELLSNEEAYLPYILGLAPHCATVKMFCDHDVEAVHCDADQIQIMAIANGWRCRLQIAYLDATPGDKVQLMTFPQDQPEAGDASGDFPLLATVLYRPGHYDVTYPKA
jgi:ubiquitin thioesterase protein OTUB1